MGCNCKKGSLKVINNTKNQEILGMVEEVYNRLVTSNTEGVYSDLDKVEIKETWRMLYPNSQLTPELDKMIADLQSSLQFLKVRYKRSR